MSPEPLVVGWNALAGSFWCGLPLDFPKRRHSGRALGFFFSGCRMRSLEVELVSDLDICHKAFTSTFSTSYVTRLDTSPMRKSLRLCFRFICFSAAKAWSLASICSHAGRGWGTTFECGCENVGIFVMARAMTTATTRINFAMAKHWESWMDRMASDSAQHSCVRILYRYFAEFNLDAIRTPPKFNCSFTNQFPCFSASQYHTIPILGPCSTPKLGFKSLLLMILNPSWNISLNIRSWRTTHSDSDLRLQWIKWTVHCAARILEARRDAWNRRLMEV